MKKLFIVLGTMPFYVGYGIASACLGSTIATPMYWIGLACIMGADAVSFYQGLTRR